MDFKEKDQQMTFADLDFLESNFGPNTKKDFLEQVQRAINWSPVEKLLNENDELCKESPYGPPAYSPLFLFKCLLLQKFYNINSDPGLESQINDSIGFRLFLGLGSNAASPDHSTFSKFRGKLGKRLFERLTHNIMEQFSDMGIKINQGIAVDARIVKSASKILKKEELKAVKAERLAPGGDLDRNGKVRKFSRDIESDWTIKNDRPYYGMKEHAAVDVEHGFILSTVLSPASVHDTRYFVYSAVDSLYAGQRFQKVFADKGYHSRANREFLSLNDFEDGIMRKGTKTAKLTEREKERNKEIGKFRYIVEQYFGISHLHDTGERARFTTIAKNNIDIWLRQFAYNLRTGIRLLRDRGKLRTVS